MCLSCGECCGWHCDTCNEYRCAWWEDPCPDCGNIARDSIGAAVQRRMVALGREARRLFSCNNFSNGMMWRIRFMDRFSHGIVKCSCGYETQRCDCHPDTIVEAPNICLSCQEAMSAPNVQSLAIEAIEAEARRLMETNRFLFPNDPRRGQRGRRIAPIIFLAAKDKLGILLHIGCDWLYWARRARIARWREIADWDVWKHEIATRCFDCGNECLEGHINLPSGVFLCNDCKAVLDHSKETLCDSTPEALASDGSASP